LAPLPQGQGSFRPTSLMARTSAVMAWGWYADTVIAGAVGENPFDAAGVKPAGPLAYAIVVSPTPLPITFRTSGWTDFDYSGIPQQHDSNLSFIAGIDAAQ